MEKVRAQIMLNWQDYQFLNIIMVQFQRKNLSQAVEILISEYQRKDKWIETFKKQVAIDKLKQEGANNE